MITDRAFQCLTCEKSFKLQFHLKRHVPICKKSHEYVSCEDCGKKLVSKRVLKVHKLSCNPNKVYTCSECSSIFDVYSMLVQHRNKEHSKILCDFCDHYCHFSNLKRHIKNNHKGLRPSTARNVVEFQKRKYQCETCENYFFDKSTLNRHQRSHCYQCDLCEKNFKSKQTLEAHKVIHASKITKSVKERRKKRITWNHSVKIAPVDVEYDSEQFELNTESQERVVKMFDILEDIILSLCGGENLFVDWSEVKDLYSQRTGHEAFDRKTLKAIISIYRDCYEFGVANKDVFIKFKENDETLDFQLIQKRRFKMQENISSLGQMTMELDYFAF